MERLMSDLWSGRGWGVGLISHQLYDATGDIDNQALTLTYLDRLWVCRGGEEKQEAEEADQDMRVGTHGSEWE